MLDADAYLLSMQVFQFSLFISFNAFNVFINALNKRFTNDLAYNAIGQDNIYQMI